MFWVGGLPALLALYIRFNVKESEAWKQHRVPTMGAVVKTAISHWKVFGYLVLLMTLMVFLSHGTQDLYPDFLKSEHGVLPKMISYLAILYNVGAILGAIVFGQLSQSIGRRKGMIAALALTLVAIPAWAFGGSLAVLAAGAFFVQAGVQGTWGIIPAHINELSPNSVRGLLPGFAYQLGILFAAGTGTIEYALRNHLGYAWALTGFETANILILATVVALGSERHGKDFVGYDAELTAEVLPASSAGP
jgi:SHS family lactate transporter-like MFS transporter